MMNKTIKILIGFFFGLFILTSGWLLGQGLNDLADNTAKHIGEYFADRHNVIVSVIKFENVSGISDLAAQKFYQLLTSRLETVETFTYTDLMINFNQNKGVFNLNRIHRLNHLIYLKLTRNKARIGVGISIFSRTLDKIVYIKYLETDFVAPERDVFDTSRYGFQGIGFSRIVEMEAEEDLLDVRSFLDKDGHLRFLFLYPTVLQVLKLNVNRLNKLSSFKLVWDRPYFPVMKKEGRLSVFLEGGLGYVTVGCNFSSRSKLLIFNNDRWENPESRELNFVPLKRLNLNGRVYIAGARYEPGKNFFQNSLVLIPFENGKLLEDQLLEKEVMPFYIMSFSIGEEKGILNSIHIIDRDYNYRFLADNFEELTVDPQKRGSAMASLGGQWLALSDFSMGRDKLFFYKIQDGSRQLIFENQLDGEIQFISSGIWKAAPGFWILLKRSPITKSSSPVYKLQFWSKKAE
jgi:hypothetical protein